jgi:hypothetical protein
MRDLDDFLSDTNQFLVAKGLPRVMTRYEPANMFGLETLRSQAILLPCGNNSIIQSSDTVSS